MNCSACGSPLQFDRVVFRCSCDAFVHAYCVDKHIVKAHRPEMEEGYADLNGEFHPKHKPEPALKVAAAATTSAHNETESITGQMETEGHPEELLPGEEVIDASESEADEGDEPEEDR